MKEVLKKIKPDKKEQQLFRQVTTDFLKKVNSQLKNARAILGGSGAKGTWLSGNYDVDVFVLFDYKKYSSQSAELSSLLLPQLKKSFPKEKIHLLHGSRDYFQTSYRNLNFEIVPILKINKASEAINITDISPLHALWVNKHATKLKEEILLAKQFCKANGLYGAESYVGGFSGYVLEILIAKYGSLSHLLQACLKWKVKEVIDIENYYPKKDALFQLNQSKLQSPLIVIDPVDKERNAAAALSLEKFNLLKKKAQEYLQKPSLLFFEKKRINIKELRQEVKNKSLVLIQVFPLLGKEDVVGGKLLKIYHFLKKELSPFSIIKSGWEWEENKEATFYFILNKKELPAYELRAGPPLKLKEHVDNFKKKNKETFIDHGRIIAKIKITCPELNKFLSSLMKVRYLTEKVKRIKKAEII